MPPQDSPWKRLRAQMPVTERWAYLDNAAVAPLSAPAQQAIQAWTQAAAEEGDTVWPQWAKRVEACRLAAATLISSRSEEIALVPNTTTGISLVAEGFPWSSGDNVVIPDNEFPSNAYPWLNLESRGVEVRRVPVERYRLQIDDLMAASDARTRMISLSWVGYVSGWRIDMEEMIERAHERKILVFLDAIQGLGVFPLDVSRTEVDFLAADGHKWMLGPEGAGLLYVRSEHLERLRPLGVGWNSVVHSHDYSRIELNLVPTAARYEGGSANMPGLHGFGASLQLLLDCGAGPQTSAIADRVLYITDYACERLSSIGAEIVSPRDGDHRSGIVSFDLVDRDPAALRRTCLANQIVLSCRGGHLRISPHAYASESDVDRLVDCLRK